MKVDEEEVIMKRFNKIIALVMGTCLSLSATTFAEDVYIDTSGSSGDSILTVDAEAIQFSVTLPMALNIAVQSDGSVVCATEAQIINNSVAPVVVSDISVTPLNGWYLADFESAFKQMSVGTQCFGLQLNNENASTSGKFDLSDTNWPTINGNSYLPLSYDAELPPLITSNKLKIAEIVFTMDFDRESDNEDNSSDGSVNLRPDIAENQIICSTCEEIVTLDSTGVDRYYHSRDLLGCGNWTYLATCSNCGRIQSYAGTKWSTGDVVADTTCIFCGNGTLIAK